MVMAHGVGLGSQRWIITSGSVVREDCSGMSNPPGNGNEPLEEGQEGREGLEGWEGSEGGEQPAPADDETDASEADTSAVETADPGSEPATEVFSPPTADTQETSEQQSGERRFTAPSGFDAGSTQQIDTASEPSTEVLSVPDAPAGAAAAGAATEPIAQPRVAGPQIIPPRADAPAPPRQQRSWGWVIAAVLVIAALVAIAVLVTVLLTRDSGAQASREDMVRSTIEDFDVAVQNGDLATLRSITCGETRNSYVNYDEQAWADTHARVSAANQYPVVASIDQVVINGDHAEANVTSFMAYAPQTRSTRSFDLQFRDNQWKICLPPMN